MDDSEHPPLRAIAPIPLHKQDEICTRIANGEDEETACAAAVIPYSDFLAGELLDPIFFEKLKAAASKRGDHWHRKIMKDADDVPGKDFAAGEKLRFEKMKWLAKIDNPEKYGDKIQTSLDIRHSIVHSVKRMTVAEAKQILNEDPFSAGIIEAEIVPPKKKEYSL